MAVLPLAIIEERTLKASTRGPVQPEAGRLYRPCCQIQTSNIRRFVGTKHSSLFNLEVCLTPTRNHRCVWGDLTGGLPGLASEKCERKPTTPTDPMPEAQKLCNGHHHNTNICPGTMGGGCLFTRVNLVFSVSLPSSC